MYVVFYLLNDWLEYIRNAAFTGRWKVKVVQFVFGWVFKNIMYHVKVFEVCLSSVAVYDLLIRCMQNMCSIKFRGFFFLEKYTLSTFTLGSVLHLVDPLK